MAGVTRSLATGTLDPGLKRILDYRSPHRFLSRIKVPTLVQGGTSDTLFPLANAIRDFRSLKARGVPVKLVWNCEGHSVCQASKGPLVERYDRTVVTWMDRWLRRDRSVETGRPFSWIADNESRNRAAPAYPPVVRGRLRGSGRGTLLLKPASSVTTPGLPLFGAKPAAGAVNVEISAPRASVDVVGAPRVTITYSGRGLPARTWIYAQVVDRDARRVVGSQVTPIPVVLDGRKRWVTIELNAIAVRASSTSSYRLQLTPGSLIFGLQRSTGAIRMNSIAVTLPVI